MRDDRFRGCGQAREAERRFCLKRIALHERAESTSLRARLLVWDLFALSEALVELHDTPFCTYALNRNEKNPAFDLDFDP